MPKYRCLLSALATLWYPRQQSRAHVPWVVPPCSRWLSCHFSTSRAARSGAGLKLSAPLLRQPRPILPINASQEHLLRAEVRLEICSLMDRTDLRTHLPNRWLRFLFDACLHQASGVKGSTVEVPEGVRETHGGGVPGSGS